VVGLLHPETHFTEQRAGSLRRETYRRLRRHWQFRNNLKLFEEPDNGTEFGVSVYGAARQPLFLSACSIYRPDTIDRSLIHNGEGVEPGLRDELDRWDFTPHIARITRVDRKVLAGWAELLDGPGTSPDEARMARPVNRASQDVLRKMAGASRFGGSEFMWTPGWHESADRRAGFFVQKSDVPRSLTEVILQGPHFTVATPFAKQPNETMRSNKDYTDWDHEKLPELAMPRTSYQPAKRHEDYIAGYPTWDGKPANSYFRLAWRNMVDSSTVRTHHAALIPPGPTHVHTVHTLTTDLPNLVLLAGMSASVAVDFLVKVAGVGKVQAEFMQRFPHPLGHPLVPEMALRALRLNCLTRDYEPLWAELYDKAWLEDSWTHDRADRPAMGGVSREWTMGTPLRTAFDRRQALVEIDALAAIMLGITAEELCTIYRTQFGVLRKYERVMHFDANGREVPKDVMKAYEKDGERADLGRYVLPFQSVDREKEMTRAHEVFTERLVTRG
jgi:hypothetical protein